MYKEIDKKLAHYFERDADKIKCRKGCSFCCENADYPLTLAEMRYLMEGFNKLDKVMHDKVKNNIKALLAAEYSLIYPCPFLVDGVCSVYSYRPFTCRVHGLAYMKSDGIVKLPECVRQGLNYSGNFDGEAINFEPIKEDLNLDKFFKGESRSLIDWFRNKS